MTNKEKKTEKKSAMSRLHSWAADYRRENFGTGRTRGMTILYYTLTLFVVAVLIERAIRGNYENCFTCALTLILFLIPNFVEKRLRITLPHTLEVIIILFIFSAEMLGEIRGFYLRIPWWDTMLHTLNGFLMAAVGFSMVDILNKNERFKFYLSPMFIAVVSFCFSMTIGVIWEFFEYFMDVAFATDMQKDTILNVIRSVDLHPEGINVPISVEGIGNMILTGDSLMVDGALCGGEYAVNLGGFLDIGLVDTMNDLWVNFIGAVVFSILGYIYIKTRGEKSFVERFIPKRKTENE